MLAQNPAPKLTILKASAGSGKTYSLALEYIAQAIKDNGDFRQILAVTFTNKATKEMKERIVQFLKNLSEAADETLSTRLQEKTGLSPEQIKKRSSLVLKKILHNYSHFSVSTIDSFNQKILRAFTREIGLIGNFNLELDTRKVVEMGVDLVLESSSEKPEIKKWLLEFVNDRLQQGKSWDIKRDLKSLAMELYNESFRLLEAEFSYALPTTEILKLYIEKLRKIKYSFENQMKSFGREAEKIATDLGLEVSDFKYGKAGAFNYFLKIQTALPDYTPGSRVLECAANPDNWATKNSLKKDEVLNAVGAGIQRVLEETLDFFQSKNKEYVTADSILRNVYALGLFSEIKSAIDQYKRDNDLFLLTDTNTFLRGIIGENEAPFIYEKSGSWYRNYLIDEFQDTSKLQWANFKLLVENALSQAHENLIVGDAKQSIYRWRGGDWQLIEKDVLSDFNPSSISSENLATNWRSSAEIIEFNNALFAILPEIFHSTFEGIRGETDVVTEHDFHLIYQTANQQTSPKNLDKPGFVKADFSQKEGSKDEWKEVALLWLQEKIDMLLDLGYSPGSIAILTRTKSEGARVVDFLHELKLSSGRNYPVLSNESLLLKNFPAIRFIINSLKFITYPESELALANVAVEYFYTKNSAGELNDLLSSVTFKEELTSLFPEKFLANIATYRKHGLLEAISEIIDVFELNSFHENTAILTAFQDMVIGFVHDNTNDVGAFLEWWEEESNRQALRSPENMDAIQVMTIHKSKGLEFDHVLIPFMNWDTDHSPTNDVFIWCENKEKPFDEVKMVPLRYQSRLAESHFANEYFDEKRRAFVDSLNLSYVAFTRAKKGLFLHGETPSANGKKGKRTFSISDLIFEVLGSEDFPLAPSFDAASGSFEFGTLAKNVIAPKEKTARSFQFLQNSWSGKAELKRRGREFLLRNQGDRIEKINYGLLVHEILAELRGFEELNTLISRYRIEGLITPEETKILQDQLDRVLANPEVSKWFQGEWEVKMESSILSKNATELRPDRVMIKSHEAIIVDFKTGKEEPGHAQQLIRYRNKLIEMGYQKVSAYLLYIASNKVKQIVR